MGFRLLCTLQIRLGSLAGPKIAAPVVQAWYLCAVLSTQRTPKPKVFSNLGETEAL